jgi:PAS domain S-box-containing protein
MLKVMEEEGFALTEGLIQSSKNVLRASSIIEPMLFDKLLSHAKYIAKLSQMETIEKEKLAEIAAENDLSRIDMYDMSGKLSYSSSPYPASPEVGGLLQAIFDGETSELPLGIIGNDFGVAVRSHHGALACYIEASYIEDFKKEMGIGSLIEAMSGEGGVEYIALQDTEGILFASQNVTSLVKLDNDPFLKDALLNNRESSRMYAFGEQNVLEVVKPFFVDNTPLGVFRVGLSLDGYNQIVKENRRHIIVLVAVIFLIGVVVFGLIIANQNYAVLDKSYSEIKTLTGSILESIASAVVALDAKGKITMLNRKAESLFSISRSVAVGKAYLDIFPEDECLLDETLRKGRTIEDVAREYRKLGSEQLSLSIVTSTLFDPSNAIQGAVAVIRDVTSIRKMEETMKQKERLSALGDMAASVAHEIRNPLNAIALTSQRLEEELDLNQDTEGFLKVIRDEIERLNGIVEQFLGLTRPMRLELSETDINGMMTGLMKLLEAEINEKSITIEKRFAEILPLRIDVDEMKKAVLNILRNAIQAMGPEGELTVTTESTASECRIIVADNGCGISEDDVAKIFRPYFSHKDGGTGLGLSITHRIVTEHGGSIDVESKEGVGTTFTIILPLRR